MMYHETLYLGECIRKRHMAFFLLFLQETDGVADYNVIMESMKGNVTSAVGAEKC